MSLEEQLMGNFNWVFDTANDVWLPAPAAVKTERKIATGQVVTGAHKLYWLKCNPSAGNSVWELTDDTDGSTAVVLDCFHTSREGHVSSYSPPMQFNNGIYLKTFTNMTSMVFAYV